MQDSSGPPGVSEGTSIIYMLAPEREDNSLGHISKTLCMFAFIDSQVSLAFRGFMSLQRAQEEAGFVIS